MVFSRRGSQVIVAAWLAAIVAAGIAAGIGFRIDNSVSVWFGAEDPSLATWRKIAEDGRPPFYAAPQITGRCDATDR